MDAGSLEAAIALAVDLAGRARGLAAADAAAPEEAAGQHFLTDRHYLDRIVAEIDPQPGEAMVEIGPGPGALTERLAQARRGPCTWSRSTASSPRPCAGASRRRRSSCTRATRSTSTSRALPADLRVVGNLPYNVSTPLLFHVAAFAPRIRDCVFMLQKEVVERMVAAPGHAGLRPPVGDAAVPLRHGARLPRAAGRLHAAAQGRLGHRAHGAARRGPPVARDEALFERIVMAAFTQRRKTLRNALRALVDAQAFAKAGIDPRRRGETLSVARVRRPRRLRAAAALGACWMNSIL